jgi:pimeloyl-ACP methyl ester carboxylesterase
VLPLDRCKQQPSKILCVQRTEHGGGFVRIGTTQPLVLSHGSLSSSTDWMRVAELLASRHTCVVMDRRGCGRVALEFPLTTSSASMKMLPRNAPVAMLTNVQN